MSVTDVYQNLKQKIYDTLKINIAAHSVLDCIIHAVADMINACRNEFEEAKDPHIYSNLKGKRIDGIGYLVNCPRKINESDANYLARTISWSTNNESSNTTAISNALSNLQYASHAEYVPFIQGTSTACVYIIPKEYEETTINNALEEVRTVLSKVISADSYILYSIPEKLKINVSCYIEIESGKDIEFIKSNIKDQIETYVNSIPIGEYLTYGKINHIGVNTTGVSFFNVAAITVNGAHLSALKRMQIVKTKFILNTVYWNEVTN